MSSPRQARYDALSQLFHWVTALAVLGAFVLGPGDFGRFVDGGGNPGTRWDIVWHESLGIFVFAMTLLRLLWVTVRPSPPRFEMSRHMHIASKMAHGFLWLLLLSVPFTALLTLAGEDFPLTLLGSLRWDTVPVLSGSALAGWTDWGELHQTLGDVIIWLAGAHAAAAIFHHWVMKDGVLKSMLP